MLNGTIVDNSWGEKQRGIDVIYSSRAFSEEDKKLMILLDVSGQELFSFRISEKDKFSIKKCSIQ
jgi:hypothetical protein